LGGPDSSRPKDGRNHADAKESGQVKVVVDVAVLRRPHTGTARWVNGLLDGLGQIPTMDLISADGPRRIGNGMLFRPINVTRQLWWYYFGIRRLAEKCGADALLMPAGYSARRGRVPQLVAILDVNFLTGPGTYGPLFTRYTTWAMKKSVRAADRLVTISAFSRSEISRHLNVDPERISVVYPGLYPPRAVDIPRPLDGPYALYVGVTEPSKNLSLLLDAWSCSSPAGLPLAIVGQPGHYHAILQRRAAGMDGRVIVRGRVDQDELEAWYRGASIFMFPSRTEGFGFPPLEAMQRSVPVISSNSGSLPEILGNAALYHDPEDAPAVRELVERLMGDADLRQRQIDLGLTRAARYRWNVTAEQLAQLMASMAAGSDG
jgi:glycosyltransferase involved in cell wall biosynthesis